jgi:hypothetical protein
MKSSKFRVGAFALAFSSLGSETELRRTGGPSELRSHLEIRNTKFL